jgi:ribosomal protein S18 acetylase RimI-like enzyme
MDIRFANIEDIDKIVVLEEQASINFSNERPDLFYVGNKESHYNWIKKCFDDNNTKIFIAEEKEIVIGYCTVHIREIKDHDMMQDRIIIVIGNLYIEEKSRKKGIGKMFFEEAKKYAKREKIKFIELMVWEYNQNAINFYEHLGMKTQNRTMELEIE